MDTASTKVRWISTTCGIRDKDGARVQCGDEAEILDTVLAGCTEGDSYELVAPPKRKRKQTTKTTNIDIETTAEI
mgnify:FL=1